MNRNCITVAQIVSGLGIGGGVEWVVYWLTSNLDRDRYRVIVCCLQSLGELGERLREQGIPVFVSNEVSTGDNNVATGSLYVAKHALGLVTKGLADVEYDRVIRKRGTDIVATGRWGVVELIDEWGLKLTSDVS